MSGTKRDARVAQPGEAPPVEGNRLIFHMHIMLPEERGYFQETRDIWKSRLSCCLNTWAHDSGTFADLPCHLLFHHLISWSIRSTEGQSALYISIAAEMCMCTSALQINEALMLYLTLQKNVSRKYTQCGPTKALPHFRAGIPRCFLKVHLPCLFFHFVPPVLGLDGSTLIAAAILTD